MFNLQLGSPNLNTGKLIKRSSNGVQARPLVAPASRRSLICYARKGADSVVVRFNIAFKTSFGQHLRLVGDSDNLGHWDLARSVPMEWSEGDVWTAELRIPANVASEVEYKYVVCKEGDLSTAWWKPGGNFVLSVPQAGSTGSVKIRDAWDNAFREVQIEVVKDENRRKSRKAQKKEDDEDIVAIARAADKALDQLDSAVNMSDNLADNTQDPASVEMLAADRMVAAAAHRASAMGKALDAARTGSSSSEKGSSAKSGGRKKAAANEGDK